MSRIRLLDDGLIFRNPTKSNKHMVSRVYTKKLIQEVLV